MLLVASFALAQVAGAVADRRNIPGGPILLGLIVTGAVWVTTGGATVPDWVTFALVVALAVVLGVRMTRDNLTALRRIAVPSVLAASILLVAGLAIGYLVRELGIAPHGDLLATSPAALSIIGAVAVEHGFDPAGIALFHVARIMLVVVTLPLLVRFLRDDTGVDGRSARAARPAASVGARAGGRDTADALRSVATGAALLALAGGVAVSVGLLTETLDLPLPLLLPPFLAVSALALVVPRPIPRPRPLAIGVQAGFGWLLGTSMTRAALTGFESVAVGALLSSSLLIVAGVGVALLLRRLGIGPKGEMLATSPGGLEALVLIADDRGVDPMEVTLYHTVRMLLVMLSLPGLVLLAR